jgi:hypothetical protein
MYSPEKRLSLTLLFQLLLLFECSGFVLFLVRIVSVFGNITAYMIAALSPSRSYVYFRVGFESASVFYDVVGFY